MDIDGDESDGVCDCNLSFISWNVCLLPSIILNFYSSDLSGYMCLYAWCTKMECFSKGASMYTFFLYHFHDKRVLIKKGWYGVES